MTHTAPHDHPVGRGFLLFGLATSALAWTTYVLWLMAEQLLTVIRG